MIGAVICSLGLIACGGNNSSKDNANFTGLNNAADSLSYFIGSNMAEGLKRDKMDSYFADAAFIKGFYDNLNGGDSALLLSPQDGMMLAQKLSQLKQQEKMQEQKAQYTDKIKAGEDFLNEKSREEGVVTLPSGLRYKVIKAGNGEKPQLTDEVTTHYHGTLLDGTVFDSSVERGEPAKFPVNRVIPAWTEALQLMPVGSKWEIYAPYDLAYGEMGTQGGPIGPYETLIFEVELISINNAGAGHDGHGH